MEKESADDAQTQQMQESIATNKPKRSSNKADLASVDAASTIDDGQKKEKKDKASGSKKPIILQGFIGGDGTGGLQIKSPKLKLQQLWEKYKESHDRFIVDRTAYEEELHQAKWLKTDFDTTKQE